MRLGHSLFSGALRWGMRRLNVALERGASAVLRRLRRVSSHSFSHSHHIHFCRRTVDKALASAMNSCSAVALTSSSSSLSANRPISRAFSTSIRASIRVVHNVFDRILTDTKCILSNLPLTFLELVDHHVEHILPWDANHIAR